MSHTSRNLGPSEPGLSPRAASLNSYVDPRDVEAIQDHIEAAPSRNSTSAKSRFFSWTGDGRPREGSKPHVPAKGEKKQRWWVTVRDKLGLDKPTLIVMFKGSLAPIIALSIMQSRPVAVYFATMGYLVAIVAVLAACVFPRGTFLTSLMLSVMTLCAAAGACMLALWTSVLARQNTSPPVPSTGLKVPLTYNSSQSAVLALWLFVFMWFMNLVRARRPAFNRPVLIISIFVNVCLTQGPLMTTTAAARLLIEKLLVTFMTGLAIATFVNIFVIPVSSRQVVSRQFTISIRLLRQLLSLQKAYLTALDSDVVSPTKERTSSLGMVGSDPAAERSESKGNKEAAAAKALEQAGASLRRLMGQLKTEMAFAKRDVAWAKLDAKDFGSLHKLFHNIYIPVLGMNTMIDILQRFSEQPEWQDDEEIPLDEKEVDKRAWNAVMKQIEEPFELLSDAVDKGLEHAAICLELLPRPQKRTPVGSLVRRLSMLHPDVESGREPRPGDANFARIIADKMEAFQAKKGKLLKKWLQERCIDIDDDRSGLARFRTEHDQVQLYIILYMETLMHEAGEAVQDLVDFADEKVRNGTMSRKRLIAPTPRRLRKWFISVFRSSEEDSAKRSEEAIDEGTNPIYCFGPGFAPKRDLEHLPPATPWQRSSNVLRKISGVLSSDASMFGFRVSCATLTIGILAFLEATERFFREHRLVWALIAVTLGMTITSGQSFFNFLCRIAGTCIAMVLSLISWYIVAANPPGVLIFLWLFLFITYYFFAKYPRFFHAVIICIVTQVVVLGYELDVLLIGPQAQQTSDQPFYPTYLLAQYRLACVAGGCFVAFIWTIFPFPLTDRTWLRRELSAALYHLASQFAIISSAIKFNVRGDAGDITKPGTPAHLLYKADSRISTKTAMLLVSSTQHADWEKWEPTIGGKFPRETYEEIIRRCKSISAYMSLTSYILMRPAYHHHHHQHQRPGSSATVPRTLHSRYRRPSIWSHSAEWLSALGTVLDSLEPAHHTIMSTLTLLSHALLSGQRLPPFLPLPRPYDITRQLMRLRHAAAAVAAVSSRLDLATTPTATTTATRGAAGESSEDDTDEADSAPIRMVSSRTGLEDLSEAATVAAIAASLDRRVTRATTTPFATPFHSHRPSRVHRDVASILDPRNIEQPGYAEFAVLQVCTTLVCHDIEGLLRAVSGLVGVVDFGFSVGGSQSTVDVVSGKEKRQ